MTPIVALDCETTGVHPDRRVWEVAMIRRDDAGEFTWLWQVDDVDLSNADPFGLKVGGFYARHVSVTGGWDGPFDDYPVMYRHEREVARGVEKATRGAHLVGAVPSFDAACLDPMLRRHGLIPAWHHRLRCVETLTAGHLRREVGGLRDCAEALGLDFPAEVQHTALGDARMALAIWDAVMTGAGQ